jgi:hypothetical protein
MEKITQRGASYLYSSSDAVSEIKFRRMRRARRVGRMGEMRNACKILSAEI